jgi:hypothetical protein
LINRFEITQLINLAASGVNPSDRQVKEVGHGTSFFDNLHAVLTTFKDLRLLQIGTSTETKREDSYFIAKNVLRNLLEKTRSENKIAVLDLPKVIGAGEPLGRFTSNLMHSLIKHEEISVLHPCHKRNFISINDVVKIIMLIVKIWNSGGSDFPEHRACVISNYEVTRFVMNLSKANGRGVSFSHTPTAEGCNICPIDETTMLVKPEFFGSKAVNYFLMEDEISVEEALSEQFEKQLMSYQK